MKKGLIFILTLYCATQNAFSQTKPVEVYSSNELWKSVPTKDGKGFTFTNTIIAKGKYRFAFYKDHITLTSGTPLNLKIKKIDKQFQNETDYYVSDLKGKRLLIVLYKGETGKKQNYDIDLSEIAQNGKLLTETKFGCNKISL